MTVRTRRSIVIVAFPGAQLLDVAGPLEVFTAADDERDGAYRIDVVTADDRPSTTSSGLTIGPTTSLPDPGERIDTVIIAGGNGTPDAIVDGRITDWLRAAAPNVRRLTSVCSGAFLLAEAGLLEGRRATTHWSVCELLQSLHPSTTVESDAIYVRDGNIATSAGVTAGMDLSLALVEEDLGRDVALAVARRLVLFVRRPGGQSQFSAQLEAQTAEREPLKDLQAYIHEHPADDLSVAALAERAAMSPRHLARLFAREVGVTPAVYVERVRVEVARRLLEETNLGLDAVAAAAGFGSVETLRRSFHRRLHVSPSDYRARFRTADAVPARAEAP